jgi:hypothetical protein
MLQLWMFEVFIRIIAPWAIVFEVAIKIRVAVYTSHDTHVRSFLLFIMLKHTTVSSICQVIINHQALAKYARTIKVAQ